MPATSAPTTPPMSVAIDQRPQQPAASHQRLLARRARARPDRSGCGRAPRGCRSSSGGWWRAPVAPPDRRSRRAASMSATTAVAPWRCSVTCAAACACSRCSSAVVSMPGQSLEVLRGSPSAHVSNGARNAAIAGQRVAAERRLRDSSTSMSSCCDASRVCAAWVRSAVVCVLLPRERQANHDGEDERDDRQGQNEQSLVPERLVEPPARQEARSAHTDSVEALVDLGQQLLRQERLQHQDVAFVEEAGGDRRVARVSGDVEHSRLREAIEHDLRKVRTDQPGHHHVGDQQVDRVLERLHERARLTCLRPLRTPGSRRRSAPLESSARTDSSSSATSTLASRSRGFSGRRRGAGPRRLGRRAERQIHPERTALVNAPTRRRSRRRSAAGCRRPSRGRARCPVPAAWS